MVLHLLFIIYINSYKLINTIAIQIQIQIQLSDNMDKGWK